MLKPPPPPFGVVPQTPPWGFLLAPTGGGLGGVAAAVSQRLGGAKRPDVVMLPFSAGRARAWLFDQGVVEAEEQLDDGLRLRVTWTDRQKARFADVAP